MQSRTWVRAERQLMYSANLELLFSQLLMIIRIPNLQFTSPGQVRSQSALIQMLETDRGRVIEAQQKSDKVASLLEKDDMQKSCALVEATCIRRLPSSCTDHEATLKHCAGARKASTERDSTEHGTDMSPSRLVALWSRLRRPFSRLSDWLHEWGGYADVQREPRRNMWSRPSGTSFQECLRNLDNLRLVEKVCKARASRIPAAHSPSFRLGRSIKECMTFLSLQKQNSSNTRTNLLPEAAKRGLESGCMHGAYGYYSFAFGRKAASVLDLRLMGTLAEFDKFVRFRRSSARPSGMCSSEGVVTDDSHSSPHLFDAGHA